MSLRIIILASAFSFVIPFCPFVAAQGRHPTKNAVSSQSPEAPVGFDNQSNGMVDDQTHQADQTKFDEIEAVSDGLGPLYNAQSCRECHQNPTSGGGSQVTELRVGHIGLNQKFENPRIPIAHGAEIISGRTLVNDRAICPSGAFPDTEIQERVPDTETIRTTRVSLSLFGDAFVEAVPGETLMNLAANQCKSSHGKICGAVIFVPIIEAPGQAGIGRFGWKNQHASLLSFSGDAYLNEMGITTRLFPDEVTNLCNTVSEPNDTPGPDGLADVDHFARFIRSMKAPPRDRALVTSAFANRGSELFEKIGCAVCHVRTLVTGTAGTKINGGTYAIPTAIGDKAFHPYSDFLMHDVGTGDGIVIPTVEHYGRATRQMPSVCTPQNFEKTRNRVRTAPLWGVRMRTRLMHDGTSLTFTDAIFRHRGESEQVTQRFRKLSGQDQAAIFEFLRSL